MSEMISKTPSESNIAWFDSLESAATDWHLLGEVDYAGGGYVRIVNKRK